MKTVLQSVNWTIYWHDKGEIIHFVFTVDSQNMLLDEYLNELKAFILIVEKYQPKGILADTRDFNFTIVPSTQEWINENILTLYAKVGVKKHAVLVSKHIFTSVSVEQTMEEEKSGAFLNEYFEDEDDAKKWLLAD